LSQIERKLGMLIAGASTLFFIGALATVALPFLDSSVNTPTKTAEMKRYPPHSAEARGRVVYVREGCMWCHSQAVRPVMADSQLGPVSQPGDYYYDQPILVMTQRTGPDLTWVGLRYSPSWQNAHLLNPQAVAGAGSIMPRFNYLSDQDRHDVVAYLMSLKPAAQ